MSSKHIVSGVMRKLWRIPQMRVLAKFVCGSGVRIIPMHVAISARVTLAVNG
jgi:hypothetical protein